MNIWHDARNIHVPGINFIECLVQVIMADSESAKHACNIHTIISIYLCL